MPSFVVLHLGTYPVGQLREVQGCSTLTCLVENVADSDAAIKEAATRFEGFTMGSYGPTGNYIAVEVADLNVTEVKPEGVPVNPANPPQGNRVVEQEDGSLITDPDPIEVVTDAGDLIVRRVAPNGHVAEPYPQPGEELLPEG
jgi:hypothetical protein